MPTVVVNKRGHKATKNDVYIGRPSIWGNPFRIGPDGDRSAVIRKYSEWIAQPEQTHLRRDLPLLKGKTLVCFCKPAACHGDVLASLADRC